MKKIIISSIFILSAFFLSFEYAESAPPEDRGPLSRITFIHYRKGSRPDALPTPKVAEAKPPWAGGGGGGNTTDTSSCYTFLAKDAKWKTSEDYVINPSNADNMPHDWVFNTIVNSAEKWDSVSGFNVFNVPSLDTSASFDFNTADGDNVVVFGPYSDSNVIAVTNVWGYFGGPPPTRELVEWDMLFNESYTWGDATNNNNLMDLDNIATHELGHSAGLGDLYDTTCNAMTMFGYSFEGDTDKRSLEDGDIAGISKLYN